MENVLGSMKALTYGFFEHFLLVLGIVMYACRGMESNTYQYLVTAPVQRRVVCAVDVAR